MRPRSSGTPILLVALLGLAAPRPGRADTTTPTDEARRFFDAGKQLYESDQFGAAALAFEAAYKVEPRPAILFSLAQAHRKQYYLDRDPGRLRRAVELYRKYVSENAGANRMADALQILSALEPLLARVQGQGALPAAPAAATQILVSSRSPGAAVSLDGGPAVKIPILLEVKPGQHKAEVTASGFFPETSTVVAVDGRLVVHAANLKEKPARLTIRGDTGASVSLDGRLVGTTPFPRPLELSAGRRFLTISQRGHLPIAREVVLHRGQDLKIDGDLPVTSQRVIAWGLLFGAGALAIGGGTTTVLALTAQSDADEFFDGAQNSMAELEAYEDARERRDRYVTTSAVLFGGAVALGATALLLWIADDPRVEAPREGPSVAPTITPEGDVGVSVATPF